MIRTADSGKRTALDGSEAVLFHTRQTPRTPETLLSVESGAQVRLQVSAATLANVGLGERRSPSARPGIPAISRWPRRASQCC